MGGRCTKGDSSAPGLKTHSPQWQIMSRRRLIVIFTNAKPDIVNDNYYFIGTNYTQDLVLVENRSWVKKRLLV